MKLDTTPATIHRGGVQTEQVFTIAAKGKAFEILSSGLYTDARLAIVRELCCNARDSHIANETPDVPFRVHLPNRLEPWFEVRDYGLGLSEHDVFHIFTTYFESTKDKSDDFIGCLGLGSKAPFSYADAFEVVSRFNGVKSTYSMFKNEAGIPSVAKMAETKTLSANGVAVKLSIKPEDHGPFQSRLSSSLKYFETKPEVVGISNFKWDPLPADPIRGDGWFISASTYSSHPVIAVQGGVGYKVDMAHIRPELNDRENAFIKAVHLVLSFEIGQIDIPPSREEVRYDKNTIANIVKSIKNVREQLTPQIEERIAHIPTDSHFSCFAKMREYSEENFRTGQGIGTFVQTDLVKNKLLAEYVKTGGRIVMDFGEPAVFSGIDEDKIAREQKGIGGLKHFTIRDYARPGYAASRLTRFTNIITGTHKLEPDNKTIVVLLDERARAIMKLSQHAIEDRKCRDVFAIVPNDYKTFQTNKEAQAEYQTIITIMGHPPVDLISDVVLHTESDGVAKAATTRKTYYYKFKGLTKSSRARRAYYSDPDMIEWDFMDVKSTDAPDEGLYFLVHAHRNVRVGDDSDTRPILWKSSFQSNMTKVLTMINRVKGTEYTLDDVWGAQTGHVSRKLTKDPKWTNVFSLASECFDDIDAVAALHTQIQTHSHFVGIDKQLDSPKFKEHISSLRPDSKFLSIIQPLLDVEKFDTTLFELVEPARDIAKALHGPNAGGMADQFNNPPPPLYDTEEIIAAYPMLTYVEHNEYDEDNLGDEMFAYINLIDGQQS